MDQQPLNLSIIIVSYNTKELLKACLQSLIASIPSSVTYEILVVDNASSDGTPTMLSQDFPQVRTVFNTDNVGFGKANNQAFAQSLGQMIFLLNPDTTINDQTMPKLFDVLHRHNDEIVVAPQLLNPDGSVQPSCLRLPTIRNAVFEYIFGQSGAYSKYYPPTKAPMPVEAVAGAAILIPRAIIVKIGTLFDEKFYFYYEDLDLCRRLKHYNVSLLYVPEATVVHAHGASTAQRGSWAYEQNQRSAKIYFGATQYWIITQVLKWGQKIQKLRKFIVHSL